MTALSALACVLFGVVLGAGLTGLTIAGWAHLTGRWCWLCQVNHRRRRGQRENADPPTPA